MYPYDLPGVPENNTLYQDASQIQLESFGYMVSKPYPQALLVARGPARNAKWIGYRNTQVAVKSTNTNPVTAPKYPLNKQYFNAPVPIKSATAFAGQAPIRGIFTGVVDDEVTRCH